MRPPTQKTRSIVRSRGPRAFLLVAIGFASVTATGCGTLGLRTPCSPCGEVGPIRRLGQHLFHRQPSGYTDGFAPGVIGAPIGIEEPALLTPAPQTIVPEGFPPASELPGSADDTLDLRPLDSTSSTKNSGASFDWPRRSTSRSNVGPEDSVIRSSAALSADPLRHLQLEVPEPPVEAVGETSTST